MTVYHLDDFGGRPPYDDDYEPEPPCYNCRGDGLVPAPRWARPVWWRRVHCPECNTGRWSALLFRVDWVLTQPWGFLALTLLITAAGVLTSTLGVFAVNFYSLAWARTAHPVLLIAEVAGMAVGSGIAAAGLICYRRMVRAQREGLADEPPY